MNKGNQQESTCQIPAESVEQRDLAEGNARRTPTTGTPGPGKASHGVSGVREAARRDRDLQFTALLHHVDKSCLLEGSEALKRRVAPGVDGVNWSDYEPYSGEGIPGLHDRIHKGK